ncbi:hypothetical protein H6P81_006094 [Aristolochia fimbriata]|uniref:Uncharacterized protein n=1 Tax=Aristolochia fimbriata TaxID=158543 RepID=A0AAV7EYI5_ARIFI|nr:hypothetical protein H6P81_006094 [Aristolochia fimbriata]
MGDDETILEYKVKIRKLAKEATLLGEAFEENRLVRKVLRSFNKKLIVKVIAITKAKEIDKITLNEVIGSLCTVEIDIESMENQIAEIDKSVAFTGEIKKSGVEPGVSDITLDDHKTPWKEKWEQQCKINKELIVKLDEVEGGKKFLQVDVMQKSAQMEQQKKLIKVLQTKVKVVKQILKILKNEKTNVIMESPNVTVVADTVQDQIHDDDEIQITPHSPSKVDVVPDCVVDDVSDTMHDETPLPLVAETSPLSDTTIQLVSAKEPSSRVVKNYPPESIIGKFDEAMKTRGKEINFQDMARFVFYTSL